MANGTFISKTKLLYRGISAFAQVFLPCFGHSQISLPRLPLRTLNVPCVRRLVLARRFSVKQTIDFADVLKVFFRRFHFASVRSSYLGPHARLQRRDL